MKKHIYIMWHSGIDFEEDGYRTTRGILYRGDIPIAIRRKTMFGKITCSTSDTELRCRRYIVSQRILDGAVKDIMSRGYSSLFPSSWSNIARDRLPDMIKYGMESQTIKNILNNGTHKFLIRSENPDCDFNSIVRVGSTTYWEVERYDYVKYHWFVSNNRDDVILSALNGFQFINLEDELNKLSKIYYHFPIEG